MATNKEIREAGLLFAKRFLNNKNYDVKDSTESGYDYEIKRDNNIFYVLVKSTEKELFTQRWLEQSQYYFCKKCPNNFFLFLVKNSPENPKEYGIYSGENLKKRFEDIIFHYNFDLSDTGIFDL